MKNLLFTLLTLTVLAGGAKAQAVNETIAADADIIGIDSMATDTIIADPDPEWYVAPIPYDSVFGPNKTLRRATAGCPIDSVRIFNVDSVLTDVAIYEYGDTIRTITWKVNSDGSRVGKSKEEYSKANLTGYGAKYDWDETTNNWKGTERADTVFNAAHQNSEVVIYDWDKTKGEWSAKTKYTWKYDATYTAKVTEFLTYQRNSSNQLVLSKGTYTTWYNASKQKLVIAYSAHNGTNWSAGTKKEYDYDANSNQIKYTYYDSYNGTEWHISTDEAWTYEIINNASKKTFYQKEEWKNNVWVVSTKEIWQFNAKASQTRYEKYTYSTSKKETLLATLNISGYDESNRNTLVENFTYSNGVMTVNKSKKEEYAYWGTTTKKTSTIAYKWVTDAWVYKSKRVTGYDDAGNTKETCDYNWTNDAWVGTGSRTLTTYNSANKATEVIIQTWPTNAIDWVNYARTTTSYNSNNRPTEVINQTWSTTDGKWVNLTRKTTEYSGTKTTQEAEYKWSTEIDNWEGTKRSDWHYNTAGLNDTIKTYTPSGTNWIFSDRTVNTFNGSGTNIMTQKAHWDGEKWVHVSATRTDIIDATIGGIHQTLNASWSCEADSVWKGVVKDSASYTATGKLLFRIHCQAWKNNDWEPQYKIECAYDESDNLLFQQQLDWGTNGEWIGHYRYEYGYDEAGRQTTYAEYTSWNSTTSNWVGDKKSQSVYDEQGTVVESIRYDWSYETNDWKLSQKYLYTTDDQKRTTQYIYQLYQNGVWVNSSKTELAYIGNTTNLSKENKFEWANGQWRFTSRNESYYDNDAQAKLRREIIGSWDNGEELSFEDKYYNYACDPKACIITFKNYDGTSLQSGEVAYGAKPEYTGAEPTRPADAQYSYSFAGWDKELVSVTAAATYTAQFTTTLNEYTITFKNGEDILQSSMVPYGTKPEYTGVEPTKSADAQYTYSYAGWDAELVAVTGAATYTATFNTTVNEYTITFKNGEDVLQSSELPYGTKPTYTGAEPTKAADAQYTYSFAGWDAELVFVTGAATYNATFTTTLNEYTITFKNGEDILQSSDVPYGTKPEYTGAEPTKAGDAQYSYSFKGWDAELVSVTAAATYNATFTPTLNEYTITFKNGEDILQSSDVPYGTKPEYTGAEPTKQGDAQYSYTFNGWDSELVAVTGAATYSATFDKALKQYTITWLYDDGSEISHSDVEYGTTPTPADPSKPATAQYSFIFKGWNKQIVPVSGAATYIAVYDTVINQYTITFLFEDGVTELERVEVPYGDTPNPTYVPSLPGDEHYTYVFAGWDPELAPVTGNATYTAIFTKVPRQYTIIFMNYNGAELQRSQEDYGTTPQYTGETPAKQESTQYAYIFSGWTPEITPVAGDATYTAVFDRVLRQYTITFRNYDGSELQSSLVNYGAVPEYTGTIPTREDDEQYTYAFAGWTPAVMQVTGDATYTARYTYTQKSHEGLDDIESSSSATKILLNGQIYILRSSHLYTLTGVLVE